MGPEDIKRTVQILKHLLETDEIDPAMRIKAEEKARILQEEIEKLKRPVTERRKTALSGDRQHHKEPGRLHKI
jgi:hypothetical protein